ncbi:MAG: hypothetical protein BGP06_15485 [Rhizobiales bacterium 65-9]|mgnify:CR=1 FL=1|nr:helix-turn-helix transcriptional regulator [Hyphomicrobiales bacterium]OJY37895.1 MAG: hypothetical protein BGP06_15485 [Rhizobiales bacterium 65-9]
MQLRYDVDLNDLFHALRSTDSVSFAEVRGSARDPSLTRIGEYRHIEDGVLASIFDLDVLQPYALRTQRRKRISFSFVKTGNYSVQLARHIYLIKPVMARMTIASESLAKHTPRIAPQKLEGVVVFADPQCLIDRFGLDIDRLPDDVKKLINGVPGTEFSMEIPLAPWSWISMEQIFECRFDDVLRSIFLKSKILELLCEAIAHLNQMDRPTNNFRIPAARREQARIETAALIYRKEMRNPPSLRDLALRLGLNRNKLNAGFREIYGLTPHEYSRRVRLEWAHDRISSGAMTISEACDAVGYASHSAFTRAYGDVFGYAPSETPTTRGSDKLAK